MYLNWKKIVNIRRLISVLQILSSSLNYSEECIGLKTVSLLLLQKIKRYNLEETSVVRNSRAVATGDESGLRSGGTGRI